MHFKMISRLGRWLALTLALMACTRTETPPTLVATAPVATAIVLTDTPVPAASPTPPVTAREVAEHYLSAWRQRDYTAMYALLTPHSQATYPAEAFTQIHQSNYITLTLTALTVTVTNFSETAETAQAVVHLTYATVLVGNLEADVTLPLTRSGAWGVNFSPALIWPDLVNGQQLYMVPFIATRGQLYDRHGAPLTREAEVYSLGIVPLEVLTEDEPALLPDLARLTDMPLEEFILNYQTVVHNQYWPLVEVPADLIEKRYAYMFEKPGVYLSKYTSRYYEGAGTAAFVTGYVSAMQAEEVEARLTEGYALDQLIGRSGLEKWGESILGGHNGGQLILLDAQGQPLRALTNPVQSVDGQDLYSTLDYDLQEAAQFALGDMIGAIAVLNRDTGEVLALASSPAYNPNRFNPSNYNRIALPEYFNDPLQPLIDRAAQSSFPAGSVFKIVTMAAGMTSGLFAPDSVYECTGEWSEAGPTAILHDWTVAKELPPHGELTLTDGLTSSCNPWFWHIGYALFKNNPAWEAQVARQFGLGQPTGIAHVDEAPGLIPDPEWVLQTQGRTWEPLDSLNMAIGQGDVLVTPLQIARLMAAMGNGGTLYRPQLVLSVGVPGAAFVPEASGTLSLTVEQLTAIQTGMYNVTQEPRGTARTRFRNLPRWLKIAGKTGSAEDPGYYGTQEPHSWFAGYTFVEGEGLPDIAVAVVVQNQGQGSEFAAPIFRRVVESYFGLSLVKYPWESSVGVVKTPEPTPEPGAEATPTP